MLSFYQSNDTPQKYSFVGPQFVVVPLANAKFMLVLSGVVISNFTSNQPVGWRGDTMQVYPDRDIPAAMLRAKGAPPPNNSQYLFIAEQWATFGSLSSIFDANASVNAGFAVDEFEPVRDDNGALLGVQYNIAVQDRDASLLRVGYHITVVGDIITQAIAPIL